MSKSSFNVQRDTSIQKIKGGRSTVTLHSIQSIGKIFDLSFRIKATPEKSYLLREQAEEFIANPLYDFAYIDFDVSDIDNGYYFITNLSFDIPSGQDVKYAHVTGNLNTLYMGPNSQVLPALQFNKLFRITSYLLSSAQAVHGFPYGATPYVYSGIESSRTGKNGVVTVVKNITTQDLFPYEIAGTDMNKGDVVVYDTEGSGTEANWTEIFGATHNLSSTSDVVMDNGIIRLKTRTQQGSLKGRIDIDYWDISQNPDAWTSAGQYYLYDVSNSQDYGAHTPVVSIGKISPQECEILLTYPPHTNTPRLSISLARGRKDAICEVVFVTGAASADFKAFWEPTIPMRYIDGDSTKDANGQGNGDKTDCTVVTNNFLATYDTKTTYHSGLAITINTNVDAKYTVATNKVSCIKVKVSEDAHSVFAVAYENAVLDDPADLGGQLLYETETISNVTYR